MQCWICHKVFKIEDYGEGTCPNCGQKYYYDEGHQIDLTLDQLTLLRNNKKEVSKC